MRKINYTVRTAEGTTFHTTSYEKATTSGNRISETYLTPASADELKSPDELAELKPERERMKKLIKLRKAAIRNRK